MPLRLKADLVAFSPITPGITRAYELADELRSRGITCVSGGAHVTALPDEALEHFDAVIAGEGEGPWRELLEDFEAGRLRETYSDGWTYPSTTWEHHAAISSTRTTSIRP